MVCFSSLLCHMTCLILLLTETTFTTFCDVDNDFCEKEVDTKMTFLLMGKTGGGKSATGNSILAHKAFKTSASTTSETKEVKAGYADFGWYILKVVDGPGIEDTDLDKIRDKEAAIENLGKALMMCSEGVDAFLYVMPFGSRFTAEEKSALESLKRIFGEKYFNHVIVIITRGDDFEKSMKEEERDITFEEWCREQKGEFHELFKSCNERFILFNNREDNEEKKMAQVQKLVKFVEKLHSKNGRYNYKSFEQAKAQREKMILEYRLPQLTEKIQEKISLLNVEIGRYLDQTSTVSGINSGKRRVENRIQDLEEEIIQIDKGHGVLDTLLQTVRDLRKNLDNKAKVLQAKQKIEDEGNSVWKFISGVAAAAITLVGWLFFL